MHEMFVRFVEIIIFLFTHINSGTKLLPTYEASNSYHLPYKYLIVQFVFIIEKKNL